MNKLNAFLITIGVFVIFVLIVVGGYLGGWWLKKDTANRQSRLNRASYEEQQTYRAEIVKKIGDVRTIDVQLVDTPTPELSAQRKAVVSIICEDNSFIQGGLDSASAIFVAKECS